jgi:predicted ATPase
MRSRGSADDHCLGFVTGEPGISKSRIAEALHERLASEKHTRLRYFCSPLTNDPRVRRLRETCF